MNRRLPRTALFVLLAIICGSTPLYSEDLSYPDRLEILGLLKNRQFTELQELVVGYQQAYESGVHEEAKVLFILETLANSDPEHSEIIDDWVSDFPDDYLPYLVRAWSYYDLAWSWRGHLPRENTSPDRLEKMQNYLKFAADDLSRAIELKPRLSAADALAIKLLMLLDGREYMKTTLQESLQRNPDSVQVRASYLWTLKPQWGGEAETLVDYIDEVERASLTYPVLKQLLGYSDYIFAAALAGEKQYQQAVEHFDFAVQRGADHLVYRDRGINYYRLGEYELALENLDESLRLWPQETETLRWRSFTYQKLGKNEEALADLDLAIRLNPMNRYALLAHAKLSRKMRRYEQVLTNYEKALFYNADDAVIWFEKGMHNSHELVNFRAAEQDFKMATQLAPEETDYWYEYAAVLHYNIDCNIVEPLSKYLDLCRSGKPCRATERKWVEDASRWLEESGRC